MLHTLIAMHDDPLRVIASPGSRSDVTILALEGPLTLKNTFAFQKELDGNKPALLIVDLTHSPYMDSAGLGQLLNAYVSAQKNGRRVVLAGTGERIRALLQMTKVDTILRSYATAAEAEAAASA